jgi:hypothetical protein
MTVRWDGLTVAERRALAAEKVRQECEEQGLPFEVDADTQRRLGARLVTWSAS